MVLHRHSAPLRDPAIKMTQLDGQDCRLQAVQSGTAPLEQVIVLLGSSVIGDHPATFNELRVVADNASSVTIRAKILARIEAEGATESECTYPPTSVAGSVCLRS